MSDELDFSALLASHLCHELVGPIGAIVNGLEVLEESGDDAEMRTEALGLLGSSAAEASARLQYYRLAYGMAAGLGAEVPIGDAHALAVEQFARGKVKVDWAPAPAMVPKAVARLALNLLTVAAEALMRGGRVAVDLTPGAHLRVFATGDTVRLSDQVAAALAGTANLAEIDPRTSTAWLAAALARSLGVQVAVEVEPGRLALAVPLA
jgi:histidine phosphotransferase ChpT